NVELLQAIDRALAGRSVEFEWVKGHSGHAMNDAADRRANAAATAFSKQQDPQVGPGDRSSSRPSAAPAAPAPAPAPAPASAAPAADMCSPGDHAPAAPAPPPRTPDVEQIASRERALLPEARRSAAPTAAGLLHPACAEVGACG